MYKSPSMICLADEKQKQQVRLCIQGTHGVGKTYAALTFQNPVVMNLDRGLVSHIGRQDVHELPFHDPKFVDSIVRRSGATCPPNKKDAVKKWLMTEGLKLEDDQTFVLDGNTGLQTAYETEYNIAPVVTSNGKVDDFAIWRLKIEYFGEIMDLLKSLHCDIIYICHETPDRDKKGELNGLVRPLISGQFGDQLGSHFTDFFRAHAFEKPGTPERLKKFCDFLKLDQQTVESWLAKYGTKETIYMWQTQADEIARCKTSLVGAPKYIPADRESFLQFRRKIETTK